MYEREKPKLCICVSFCGSIAELNAEMLSLMFGGAYFKVSRLFQTIFGETPQYLPIGWLHSSSIVWYGKK